MAQRSLVGVPPAPRRGGFTLVETLVALTLSAFLILMVGTVFLIQNDFYAHMLQRSRVHDNARSVAGALAADLRFMLPGGLVTAQPDRLVARIPMTLGVICDVVGNDVSVHVPGGIDVIDLAELEGVGVRASDGTWSHHTSFGALGAGNPAAGCAGEGADTTGATAEFLQLTGFVSATGTSPAPGDVVMAYRETEYAIAGSVLMPGDSALFRGPDGGTLVEFATGLATGAGFQYRKGAGSWQSSVSSGLDAVDRIRIRAAASGQGETLGQSDLEFELVMDVPLRNRG